MQGKLPMKTVLALLGRVLDSFEGRIMIETVSFSYVIVWRAHQRSIELSSYLGMLERVSRYHRRYRHAWGISASSSKTVFLPHSSNPAATFLQPNLYIISAECSITTEPRKSSWKFATWKWDQFYAKGFRASTASLITILLCCSGRNYWEIAFNPLWESVFQSTPIKLIRINTWAK